jgi:UbiD family decarboxylase
MVAQRMGILLDSPPDKLTDAMNHAIATVDATPEEAKCQEVVYRATDPDFDLRKILPAPTNTDQDAGPYFCMGLVLATDPDYGTNVTIHRLCVQGKDKMTIFLRRASVRSRFCEGSGSKRTLSFRVRAR